MFTAKDWRTWAVLPPAIEQREIPNAFAHLEVERLIRRAGAKLRGCDLVKLRLIDVASGGTVRQRSTIIQQETGRLVPFEITEPTRESINAWLAVHGRRDDDWLFPSRSRPGQHTGTRQYARVVDEWVGLIDLQPRDFGTHSLRRTKVALVYKKTGNLRACQLLLGHTKLESTVRHLGIEVDDALSMSEQIDL